MVLSIDGATQDTIDAVESQIKARYEGRDGRKVLVADGTGVKAEKLKGTPIVLADCTRQHALEALGVHGAQLLVLAVNDTPLADQANGEQFLRSLSGTPQARITIERGGRTETLLLDLTQISAAR